MKPSGNGSVGIPSISNDVYVCIIGVEVDAGRHRDRSKSADEFNVGLGTEELVREHGNTVCRYQSTDFVELRLVQFVSGDIGNPNFVAVSGDPYAAQF